MLRQMWIDVNFYQYELHLVQQLLIKLYYTRQLGNRLKYAPFHQYAAI